MIEVNSIGPATARASVGAAGSHGPAAHWNPADGIHRPRSVRSFAASGRTENVVGMGGRDWLIGCWSFADVTAGETAPSPRSSNWQGSMASNTARSWRAVRHSDPGSNPGWGTSRPTDSPRVGMRTAGGASVAHPAPGRRGEQSGDADPQLATVDATASGWGAAAVNAAPVLSLSWFEPWTWCGMLGHEWVAGVCCWCGRRLAS